MSGSLLTVHLLTVLKSVLLMRFEVYAVPSMRSGCAGGCIQRPANRTLIPLIFFLHPFVSLCTLADLHGALFLLEHCPSSWPSIVQGVLLQSIAMLKEGMYPILDLKYPLVQKSFFELPPQGKSLLLWVCLLFYFLLFSAKVVSNFTVDPCTTTSWPCVSLLHH